jgi:hypothetical protein
MVVSATVNFETRALRGYLLSAVFSRLANQ